MAITGTPIASSPGSTEGLNFAAGYNEISDHLYGTFSPDATQKVVVKRLYNHGYRAVLGGNYFDPQTRTWHHHDWSFLSPATTLIAFVSLAVTAGTTVSTSGSSTTVTANSASFHPGMVGHSIIITDVGTYIIVTYTSTTVIVIDTAINTGAKTFSIDSEKYAMLPATFGGMIDPFTYGPNNTGIFLREKQVAEMTKIWAAAGTVTNDPYCFAIRPSAFSAATGQRWEVIWNSYPASDKTLYYRYRVKWSEMSSDAEFSLGGIDMNDAYVYAGLRRHEERQGGGGEFARRADEEMIKAVRMDQARLPRNLGQAGYSGEGHPTQNVTLTRNYPYTSSYG